MTPANGHRGGCSVAFGLLLMVRVLGRINGLRLEPYVTLIVDTSGDPIAARRDLDASPALNAHDACSLHITDRAAGCTRAALASLWGGLLHLWLKGRVERDRHVHGESAL